MYSQITSSGVTRVGDTRGGNWVCYPSIFSWKTWRPFFSRQFCGVIPDFFFSKPDDLFCSSLFIAFTRVSPPSMVSTLFLPVRPRFSAILCKFAHKIFFLRVSPPGGCHPGRFAPLAPLVTPLITRSRKKGKRCKRWRGRIERKCCKGVLLMSRRVAR